MGSEAEAQGAPVPQPEQPAPQPVAPPPQPVYPAPAPMKPETIKPVLAGVLLIVVALMGIVLAIVVLGYVDMGLGFMDEYFAEDPTGTATGVADMVQNIVTVCAIIFIIFALLALLGGIMAFTRKSWGFAMVGAIFGLFTIGPWGLGFVLSLVALILLIISKDEF